MTVFNTVSMVGLGYIGLPTAAVIAACGVEVIGLDVNKNVVDTINQGKIHIVEPGLEALVRKSVLKGTLRATLEAQPADAFLIAVPTPFKECKNADISYIQAAARTIAPVLKKGDLVILESTSPVGTTEQLTEVLAAQRPDLHFPTQDSAKPVDINVAYCPERVLPGKVLHELVANDRVIGGITPACSEKAKAFYEIFVKGECVISNARTAEMAKLTENSFRDVNIAFANELSMICDELNIDVWELISVANRHPRVNILSPGPGVGGHCIAVDPWFIISKTPDQARLIKTARQVNDLKPKWVINKVISACDTVHHIRRNIKTNPVIAVYGLSFKADIDDLRESPAVDITQQIAQQSLGTLLVVEPNIKKLPKGLADSAQLVSLEQAQNEADIHLLLVDHKQFAGQPPRQGLIIDTKGIWPSEGAPVNQYTDIPNWGAELFSQNVQTTNSEQELEEENTQAAL